MGCVYFYGTEGGGKEQDARNGCKENSVLET